MPHDIHRVRIRTVGLTQDRRVEVSTTFIPILAVSGLVDAAGHRLKGFGSWLDAHSDLTVLFDGDLLHRLARVVARAGKEGEFEPLSVPGIRSVGVPLPSGAFQQQPRS